MRYTVTSFNPDRCAIEVHRGDYATRDEADRACPVATEVIVSDYDDRMEIYRQGYDATTGTWWNIYGPGY